MENKLGLNSAKLRFSCDTVAILDVTVAILDNTVAILDITLAVLNIVILYYYDTNSNQSS